MSTYEKPEAGEWVRPVPEGYKMACCDCGLVHKLDFRVERGRVEFRVFYANRSTAMVRRHMRVKDPVLVEVVGYVEVPADECEVLDLRPVIERHVRGLDVRSAVVPSP